MYGDGKVTGTVLKEQLYIGSVTPPASFIDKSRFGNDGVHTDITWVQLPSGLWVRSFNGSSSEINCGSDPEIRPTSFTALAWINTIAFGTDIWKNTILSNAGTTDGADGFTFRSGNNQLGFLVGLSVGGWGSFDGDIPLVINVWYFAAATFDNNTGSLYVDGVLDKSQAVGAMRYAGDEDFVIGDSSAFPGRDFYGYISNVRFLNYVLDPLDIKRIYESERHLFGV